MPAADVMPSDAATNAHTNASTTLISGPANANPRGCPGRLRFSREVRGATEDEQPDFAHRDPLRTRDQRVGEFVQQHADEKSSAVPTASSARTPGVAGMAWNGPAELPSAHETMAKDEQPRNVDHDGHAEDLPDPHARYKGVRVKTVSRMASDHAQTLVDVALPYWEAEGEIARRFFASAPNSVAQREWLRQIVAAFRGDAAFADIVAFMKRHRARHPRRPRRSHPSYCLPVRAPLLRERQSGRRGCRALHRRRRRALITRGREGAWRRPRVSRLPGRYRQSMRANTTISGARRKKPRRSFTRRRSGAHDHAIVDISKRRVEMCREMFGNTTSGRRHRGVRRAY